MPLVETSTSQNAPFCDTISKWWPEICRLGSGSTQSIADWLTAHAGTGRRFSEPPPDNRITKSNWFVREHDEVSAAEWRAKDVGSKANCPACHVDANKGYFEDD